MLNYIIRRLGQSAIVILIVTILVFFGMRLLPGDHDRAFSCVYVCGAGAVCGHCHCCR